MPTGLQGGVGREAALFDVFGGLSSSRQTSRRRRGGQRIPSPLNNATVAALRVFDRFDSFPIDFSTGENSPEKKILPNSLVFCLYHY